MTAAPKLEPADHLLWRLRHNDTAKHLCNLAADEIERLRAATSAGLREALELLQGFLSCPEIADCAPEDKDPETDDLERRARALTLSKEGGEVALPHQTIARDE